MVWNVPMPSIKHNCLRDNFPHFNGWSCLKKFFRESKQNMEISFSSSSECGHESMKCSSTLWTCIVHFILRKINKRLSNKMASSTWYNLCTIFPYLQIPMWIGSAPEEKPIYNPDALKIAMTFDLCINFRYESQENYAQLNSCQNDRKCRKCVCLCVCVCSFKLNTRVHTAGHMSVDDGWTTNERKAICTRNKKYRWRTK